ncbi:MAG: MtrB/PioB family decaheme-associated outer membrane protein [Halioglobus sp.]
MRRWRQASFSIAGALCTLTAGATAQADEDPFAPLLEESRPLATRLQSDYKGSVQLGLGYTSDPSFMFGQYNGLQDDGATLIGSLDWNNFYNTESYWQVSANDLGLDTREGSVTWGKVDRLKLFFEFDSQLQVRNDSGVTPFRGSSSLKLPDDWVSGTNTSDWSNLDSSLKSFDRELTRDRYSLGIDARLNDHWQLLSTLHYEDKAGTAETGAAIFTDAASGDASLLPAPVDYRTAEFDIGLLYQGRRLHMDGRLFYSDFDNRDEVLSWQNPYSAFGPNVRYPNGVGGLGLAPDNTRTSGRLTAQYLFSATTRLQFDGSYAVTEQDQDFLDYTVNPALEVSQPLPLNDLGGEVATGTANAKLLLRPLPKLNLEFRYKGMDKDYDAPRAGYQAVPGDGGNQSRSALTVYNTRHDYQSQTFGVEATYRLPLHGKLWLEYDFENIQRENAAVEETDESRFVLAYRIQPWASFNARFELGYADRAADTYQWAQSYYALLDTELINATPDKQRYQNHPDMSQFYLSNRERLEGKMDLNYLPTVDWSLNLNLLLRDEDYDKTELGLTDTAWQRLHLSASYNATRDLSLSVYGGYDEYESGQSSRAFRGGQEKNAFEVTPPLPQASDPGRNWDIDTRDSSFTLGANLQWQLRRNVELGLDYSFVDSSSKQDYRTYGASDLTASNLPTVETRLHHLELNGTWHLRDALSIRLDYQYYRYSSDDWAWQGVQTNTLGKVLTFGERNPNEQIHYVGTSVIYHWQ